MISWSPEWSTLGGPSQKAVAPQRHHNTKAHCQSASSDHTSPESYTFTKVWHEKIVLEASSL